MLTYASEPFTRSIPSGLSLTSRGAQVNSFIHSCIHSFIHSFVHSFVHESNMYTTGRAREANAAIIAELLCTCPHTAIYVSPYCYICVLYMCPHTAIYVSPYCYMCPHTGAVEENAAIIAELMPGKPTPVEVLDFA